LFWSELINGTALTTYNQLTSSKTLNVGQNGDYVVRQTKQRFKYQPGKSHEVLITGHLPTSTNIRKRCGLLDYDNKGLATITNTPQNGIFFENDGGVLSWNIVNNGVVTEKVAQSLWNIDICDGNGVSGFNLDINSTNIFFTDLEWLGVGAVRCGFVSNDGTIIIAHQFQHASIGFSDVYMRTANLPVSYEIIATGATGGGEMKAICSSVISEGGFNPKGVLRGLEMPSAGVLVTGGDKETLIGIRLKEDEFEYSIEINSISTLAESSGDGKWQILFNPTLDGVPVWSDVADSVIQQSVSNIGVLDEGIVIANGLYSSDNDASSADIENSLKIGKDLLGNRDEIWLIIESFSTERMHGTINLRELI